MIDISKLDNLFQEDEYLLQKELEKDTFLAVVEHKPVYGRLDINSTLIDLAKALKSLENFQNEYEERKNVAPNWEVALNTWINELEIMGYSDKGYRRDVQRFIENGEQMHPLQYMAYNDITQGKNHHLHQYAKYLVYQNKKGEKFIIKWHIAHLAYGVALAYNLPKLKEELKQIQDFKEATPQQIEPIKSRFNWQGTPAQFGFIIDSLIQGGYLERPTNSFEKDANFYLEHFNIDTTKGTLVKEISEKTNSLSTTNRKKIVIPHKDKLG